MDVGRSPSILIVSSHKRAHLPIKISSKSILIISSHKRSHLSIKVSLRLILIVLTNKGTTAHSYFFKAHFNIILLQQTYLLIKISLRLILIIFSYNKICLPFKISLRFALILFSLLLLKKENSDIKNTFKPRFK